ncbi:hypothetical protein SAMN04489835_4575 [Mycolicibacterium rutilum]|uniref:Uncharacterized protein n=1 Tax=Mycolicibacterium rutilum TaxID=370526 RepID=A0A1H6L2T3_MYCRU|nr:hypothetical protein [Mycolicibacterium rutilum]SEH82464.1 hypothetical protein SAMN04489835_4575 [Mycolicibacterium rutilum]
MTVGSPYQYDNRLEDTAREWQKLQLAAIGFAGLCGVLSGGDSSRPRPRWLQEVGVVTAFGGLAMAVAAVLLVATVAHPVVRQPRASSAAISRLVMGITLTFIAVVLTAVAALTWWWPQPPSETPTAPKIEVTTSQGSVCGVPVPGRSGTVNLDASGEQVVIPLRRLLTLDVVEVC